MSDNMDLTARQIWEKAQEEAKQVVPITPLVAAPVEKKLIRLDLGCGQRKEVGWTGVDFAEAAKPDIVWDLFKMPWEPIESDSVVEARSFHFFEHIPNKLRFAFFDELYRVMTAGANCTVLVPYYSSMRAIQDPTHEWPPLAETSFLYFNKDWRKQNQLDHYPVSCDFDFSYGYSYDPVWQSRSDDTRNFATKQYINVVMDLQVILTKRKPG